MAGAGVALASEVARRAGVSRPPGKPSLPAATVARVLALKPGKCDTMTHDYERHGTTTPFAAVNVLDGTVIGQLEHFPLIFTR